MPKAAVLLAALAALGAAAPTPLPSPAPSAPPANAPSATPVPSATPTLPPLSVSPALADVPVGSSAQVAVGSAISPISASVLDPSLVAVSVDQAEQRVTLTGLAVGATTLHLRDARGVARDVPVRVANYAGAIEPHLALQLTGDPASAEFVREQVSGALKRATQARPGADVLVTSDDVPMHGPLEQDDVTSFDVPVLIQGNQYFEVDGSTR
ncbi:MAG: pilus assembly protein N-terminal domain-containing protein, partial [Candidatus Eremiobacteraeota bacterium]|nr:pilus assembly protein N-terminal domain-containing protein [Candidatus Eremiobacteraeota bacterium]